jgi:hypothetical protein
MISDLRQQRPDLSMQESATNMPTPENATEGGLSAVV